MLCSTFLWKTKNLPAGSKAEIQQCHNSRDNGKLVWQQLSCQRLRIVCVRREDCWRYPGYALPCQAKSGKRLEHTNLLIVVNHGRDLEHQHVVSVGLVRQPIETRNGSQSWCGRQGNSYRWYLWQTKCANKPQMWQWKLLGTEKNGKESKSHILWFNRWQSLGCNGYAEHVHVYSTCRKNVQKLQLHNVYLIFAQN